MIEKPEAAPAGPLSSSTARASGAGGSDLADRLVGRLWRPARTTWWDEGAPLKRLSEHLGGAQIWAKREDCNSGLAYGGNKTRKLEYIVPDALAAGADTLVSIGGYQSNHSRQEAAVAAHVGLKCVLVQEKWVDWPDCVNDRVGNILLSRIMGAKVRLDPAGFDIGFRWNRALDDVLERCGVPYGIPAGASDHRLGGLGFAQWATEVEQQEGELVVCFDTIVVCSVTVRDLRDDEIVVRVRRRQVLDHWNILPSGPEGTSVDHARQSRRGDDDACLAGRR